MKRRTVNTYIGLLLIAVFGSLATFAIVDIATTNVIADATRGSISNYAALQQSILRNPSYGYNGVTR